MAYVKAHGIRMASNSSIQNLVIEFLASDPVENLVAGRVWFNTDQKVYKCVVDDAQTIKVFAYKHELTEFMTSLSTAADGEGVDLVGYEGFTGTNGQFSVVSGNLGTGLDAIVGQIDANTQELVNLGEGSLTDLANELDAVEGSVGLNDDGSYMVPSGVYVGSSVSTKDALEKLDDQVEINTGSINSLQDEKVDKAGDTMSGDLNMGVNVVVSSATPTNSDHLVNKSYADSLAAGLRAKRAVRAIATSIITLSGEQTVDGVSLVDGDRVLVAGQGGDLATPHADNGIYVVSADAWTRAIDFDSEEEVNPGSAVFVSEGTQYDNNTFVLITDNPIELDVTALEFSQYSGLGELVAGTGLDKTGNVLSVNLGAGVKESPNDEVGIDIAVDGGLFTSTEGTSASTLTDAKLYVKLDGDTLTRSAEGLKVSNTLTTQISTNQTNIGDLQTEVDNVELASGLNADGTFSADTSSISLSGATSIRNEISILDSEIDAIEAAEDASFYKETTTTPASNHTINHQLASTDVICDVWVKNDSGNWAKDICEIVLQDANSLTVGLTEARDVKVIVKKY